VTPSEWDAFVAWAAEHNARAAANLVYKNGRKKNRKHPVDALAPVRVPQQASVAAWDEWTKRRAVWELEREEEERRARGES